MPLVLKTLSQFLDANRVTLTADDLAALTEDARRLLLDQKILVPARPATHVTCDACHDDHVEEVVRTKDRKGVVSFRIPCPDAGWVEVPDERLRQWTPDVRRLVAVLAAAVGPDSQPEELVQGIAWRIGTVEIAGETYESVFVRNGGTAGETLFAELGQRLPPARTIVVGIDLLPDGTIGFAASLPLTSAFAETDDHFEFQLDHVRSLVSAQTIVAGNVFQRRGEFWQLSFDGDTKFLKDSVGLGYIARLLMEPHREVPAVTLLAARAGIDPLVTSGSSGEVLDDQARDEYGRRYRELQEELCEARANNDLGQIEKLEGEMEQLTNELASATGLGGRSRERTDIEKVRKSVSMAVSRDIERIGKQHEALGRHLTATITSGLTFRYAPEHEIDWLT